MQIPIIELPEGNYVFVEYIALVGPRFTGSEEFPTPKDGARIILGSGDRVDTDETVERILAQIAETGSQAEPIQIARSDNE